MSTVAERWTKERRIEHTRQILLDAAEEVLQDVYWKVLEGRARYDGRSTLKTWLFGVVRLTARELRRGQDRYIAGGTHETDELPDETEELPDERDRAIDVHHEVAHRRHSCRRYLRCAEKLSVGLREKPLLPNWCMQPIE